MLLLSNSHVAGDPAWTCEPCETSGFRLVGTMPDGLQWVNLAQLSRDSLEDLLMAVKSALQDADEPHPDTYADPFRCRCDELIPANHSCPKCGHVAPPF